MQTKEAVAESFAEWYNNPRRFSKVKVIAPNNILFTDGKGLLIVEKNRFRITGKFECFYPK